MINKSSFIKIAAIVAINITFACKLLSFDDAGNDSKRFAVFEVKLYWIMLAEATTYLQ